MTTQRIKILLLFCMVLTTVNAEAQFQEWGNMKYKGGEYAVFKLKIDDTLQKNIRIIDNKKLQPENEFFHSMDSLYTTYFAITSGIVDSACNPLGLLISDGKKINVLNRGTGYGNFYLQPNGFFAVDSTGVAIEESNEFDNGRVYSTAVQSGPVLVSGGVVNPAFSVTSKNKYLRCGVGICTSGSEKFLYFIKAVVPVSFYQFAELFKDKFKCQSALTFESGGNCSFHLSGISLKTDKDVVVCRYILVTL
jgi:uncharacterized protein YigE (DUF2233 family)